jgi:hypothetical protein
LFLALAEKWSRVTAAQDLGVCTLLWEVSGAGRLEAGSWTGAPDGSFADPGRLICSLFF